MKGLNVISTIKVSDPEFPMIGTLRQGDTFRFRYSYNGTVYMMGSQGSNVYYQLTGPGAGNAYYISNRADRKEVIPVRINAQIVLEIDT